MTAVSEQYSLLLQVLSPVFENPELSLTITAISFCRIAVCHHFQQDIYKLVGRLPELLTQGDSLQTCTTVALVHFTTKPAMATASSMAEVVMTAVSKQYSLLLQVLSPVFENPELSLTVIAISFCRTAHTTSQPLECLPRCRLKVKAAHATAHAVII